MAADSPRRGGGVISTGTGSPTWPLRGGVYQPTVTGDGGVTLSLLGWGLEFHRSVVHELGAPFTAVTAPTSPETAWSTWPW